MAKLYARIKDEQARQLKVLKHIIRRSFNQGKEHTEEPLWNRPRQIVDPTHEGYDDLVEYGFLGYCMTDEEIQEAVADMKIVINSQYDCTGCYFTCSIDVHRNPSGLVSYVHYMGLDV